METRPEDVDVGGPEGKSSMTAVVQSATLSGDNLVTHNIISAINKQMWTNLRALT